MSLSNITYVKGDATNPVGEGMKIIVHICNNKGGWGAGFVLALSKKWSEPEAVYRKKPRHILGDVEFVKVEEDIMVANMVAQHGFGTMNGMPPIRYGAVRICLAEVNKMAARLNATVHMPRIGCGLAGGEWSKIQNIIEDVMTVDVTVYDFN
jgi:O-acetyl-ADP-ribose deacetylase (regulator of RNase III)